MFCLLAIGGARDWAATEAIELQELDDHHIFPRNYLTKRGFDANRDKAAINSIVNRTLISHATNKLISDTAPAHYLKDHKVFPRPPEVLLPAHFVDAVGLRAMQEGEPSLAAEAAKAAYERFAVAREAAIVSEIRRACGVTVRDVAPEVAEALDDE